MRRAGADYVHLFKTKFHLVPIKGPVEFEEALRVKGFLESRTAPLSESAQDYKGVLEMILLDYEVSLLDAEEAAEAPRLYADAATLEDDDSTEEEELEPALAVQEPSRRGRKKT